MKSQNFFTITLCVVCILFGWSCQKESFSDEQISSNLLKIGTDNPELLKGKWIPFKFAYTKDGNTISDVAMISTTDESRGYYGVHIPDESLLPGSLQDDECFGPIDFLGYGFYYSRTGNLISLLSDKGGHIYVGVNPTDDESKAQQALVHAFSYVVVADELFIYFKKNKNHNLLILKKRET